MDSTLKALADLLLEAVPTIVFFVFLAWYLKRVFFVPMARILEERRKATEGVKELAQKAFEAADKKQSEFERALRARSRRKYTRSRRSFAGNGPKSRHTRSNKLASMSASRLNRPRHRSRPKPNMRRKNFTTGLTA